MAPTTMAPTTMAPTTMAPTMTPTAGVVTMSPTMSGVAYSGYYASAGTSKTYTLQGYGNGIFFYFATLNTHTTTCTSGSTLVITDMNGMQSQLTLCGNGGTTLMAAEGDSTNYMSYSLSQIFFFPSTYAKVTYTQHQSSSDSYSFYYWSDACSSYSKNQAGCTSTGTCSYCGTGTVYNASSCYGKVTSVTNGQGMLVKISSASSTSCPTGVQAADTSYTAGTTNKNSNTGGIIVGVVLGVLAFAGLTYFIVRRKQLCRKREVDDQYHEGPLLSDPSKSKPDTPMSPINTF